MNTSTSTSTTHLAPAGPRVACTANNMTFEEWRTLPVYAAHCRTYAVARELCGLQPLGELRAASERGASDENGLDTFRCLKPYRSEQAQALRNSVAQHIRSDRALDRNTAGEGEGGRAMAIEQSADMVYQPQMAHWPDTLASFEAFTRQ